MNNEKDRKVEFHCYIDDDNSIVVKSNGAAHEMMNMLANIMMDHPILKVVFMRAIADCEVLAYEMAHGRTNINRHEA